MVNTSFMMGGALGLAVLASLAAARTATVAGQATLQGGGAGEALNAGYHLAFGAGAGFVILAALIGVVVFRKGPQAPITAH